MAKSDGIITNNDYKIAAYALGHAATNYLMGKGLGRVWKSWTPFADPRLILATTLMQAMVTGVLDRREEGEGSDVATIAALLGSNALVLGVFHLLEHLCQVKVQSQLH